MLRVPQCKYFVSRVNRTQVWTKKNAVDDATYSMCIGDLLRGIHKSKVGGRGATTVIACERKTNSLDVAVIGAIYART